MNATNSTSSIAKSNNKSTKARSRQTETGVSTSPPESLAGSNLNRGSLPVNNQKTLGESNELKHGHELSYPGAANLGSDAQPQWIQLLQDRFGLSQFRSGQVEVIGKLLSGRSAAAVFPTGGGKSLCYQFCAAMLEGLTIVVSPLLALMREQVDYLNELGIPACRMDSTLTGEELSEASRAVRSGKAKLLYVAPERFFNERFRELIEGLKISLFAVDEAHCISQWGHSFRPDYLKLAQIAKKLGAERILALTATATPAVLNDMCEQFGIDIDCAVRTPFYRPNLKIGVTLCDESSREKTLVEKLKGQSSLPAIVYVTLQKTAEVVAERLVNYGLNARAYHAGMEDVDRKEIQDWFMNSSDGIIVATIAFGMGIDKSNIRTVCHFNPSKSLESFAQEIGRAGRDGLPADCHTLLVPEDRIVLENFAYGDTPSIEAVKQFSRIVAGQPEEFFVSYYQLAFETDIRDGVIRSLLTNLELRELIQSTTPRYETYKFKPKVTSTQILKQFDSERKQFAGSVLAMAVKKKVYCEIDITPAATRLKTDRGRIVRMLEYFAQQNWIELEASGLVFGYRKLQPIRQAEKLADQLYDYLQQREDGDLRRLDQLFEMMSAKGCQSRILAEHFGQTLETDCGNCTACCGQGLGKLPSGRYPRIGDSAKTAVAKLAKLHPEILSDNRSKARFLCGLTSPKFTRARLSRDSAFGICSDIPFSEVMAKL